MQIAEYAKVSGVTKIVLGRTNHSQNLLFRRKSLADKLTELAENMDIYIIPDTQPLYKKKPVLAHDDEPWFRWPDLLKTLLVIVLATLVGCISFAAGLRDANIITVYILGVLHYSHLDARASLRLLLASLLSVFAFNFFFTVPRFTLQATDPDYPVTFLIMLTASVLSSTLAIRVKKQARQAAQKAYYTELLMNSSQKLQQGRDEQEIIGLAAEQLSILLERPVLFALAGSQEPPRFDVRPAEQAKEILPSLTKEEQGVADWVVKNNKRAGATTTTLSHAQNLYMTVRGVQGVMGWSASPPSSIPLWMSLKRT